MTEWLFLKKKKQIETLLLTLHKHVFPNVQSATVVRRTFPTFRPPTPVSTPPQSLQGPTSEPRGSPQKGNCCFILKLCIITSLPRNDKYHLRQIIYPSAFCFLPSLSLWRFCYQLSFYRKDCRLGKLFTNKVFQVTRHLLPYK